MTRDHDHHLGNCGGLGASFLLPAMQSLIHGYLEGSSRKKAYALVGASAAIAAVL
jgi:hypothetical protein